MFSSKLFLGDCAWERPGAQISPGLGGGIVEVLNKGRKAISAPPSALFCIMTLPMEGDWNCMISKVLAAKPLRDSELLKLFTLKKTQMLGSKNHRKKGKTHLEATIGN